MPPVHRLGWPERHCGQLPQKPERQATTWSPGRTVVTSAPTASTIARALVAQHDRPVEREAAEPVDDMQVAVAHAGRDGAHQHLAAPRLVDVDRLDRQRFMHLAKHGSAGFHDLDPPASD